MGPGKSWHTRFFLLITKVCLNFKEFSNLLIRNDVCLSTIFRDLSLGKKNCHHRLSLYSLRIAPPPPLIPQEETCLLGGKGSAASSRIVLTIDVSFKVWQAIFILITMKNLISMVIQPKWISTGSRYTSSVIAWD